MSVASRSQCSAESEPYCHSGMFSACLLVIPWPTAYHDWSITTKFGRQVYTCPWTRVSLFGSPVSHTLGARWKKYGKFRLFPTHNACHLDIRAQIKKKPMWVYVYVDGQYCAQILANSITNCRTSRVWRDPLSTRLDLAAVGRSAALVDGVAAWQPWPLYLGCARTVKRLCVCVCVCVRACVRAGGHAWVRVEWDIKHLHHTAFNQV